MKKFMLVLALALALMAPNAKAQSILLGASGANAFDNMSAGLTAGLYVPFLHRYEFDLQDVYSPYESHVGLGSGHANIASAAGLVWLGKNWGVSTKIEDSGYSVTQVSKTAFYATGGLVKRVYVFGVPTRISFGYAQQVNNGIVNGIETSHLRGAYLGFDGRLYCNSYSCLRIIEQFSIGHVLTQGNPVCDGTIGNGSQVGWGPCPRSGAVGGGVTLSVLVDLHRKNTGHEYDLY
jgi:hypothetical protein